VTDPQSHTDDPVEVEETSTGSFGDAAGEMADETEVEVGETDTPEQPEVEEGPSVERQLAERTADLQRLQAEYLNYKRRVDRDRDVSRKTAVESVLKDLLAVLDDIRSAGEHGELTGAFKAVGDEIVRVTGKHGLVTFGEKGDTFDPHVHEALLHSLSPDVSGPTCIEILQPGYRVGERVLRPARVAVAEPDGSAPTTSEPEATTPEQVDGQVQTDQPDPTAQA